MTTDGRDDTASPQRTRPLVPASFPVPPGLEHPHFRLRKLTEDLTRSDYEAVMATQQRLRAHSPNGWPRIGFTLEENRADLIRHQAEFDARVAFAYSVLAPDSETVIGCVYINPSCNADAEVYLWVREREHTAGMTPEVFAAVQAWLSGCWPFATIDYVRRDYYPPGQSSGTVSSDAHRNH